MLTSVVGFFSISSLCLNFPLKFENTLDSFTIIVTLYLLHITVEKLLLDFDNVRTHVNFTFYYALKFTDTILSTVQARMVIRKFFTYFYSNDIFFTIYLIPKNHVSQLNKRMIKTFLIFLYFYLIIIEKVFQNLKIVIVKIL